jgi:hypothetical protein
MFFCGSFICASVSSGHAGWEQFPLDALDDLDCFGGIGFWHVHQAVFRGFNLGQDGADFGPAGF